MEYTALKLLRKVAPRMIVVDEVHNLLAGGAHEQRTSLNLLKFLSNQLKCEIVVLGTRDALAAMQTDSQIARYCLARSTSAAPANQHEPDGAEAG